MTFCCYMNVGTAKKETILGVDQFSKPMVALCLCFFNDYLLDHFSLILYDFLRRLSFRFMFSFRFRLIRLLFLG